MSYLPFPSGAPPGSRRKTGRADRRTDGKEGQGLANGRKKARGPGRGGGDPESRGTWFGCSQHSTPTRRLRSRMLRSERPVAGSPVYTGRGEDEGRGRTVPVAGGWLIFLGQRIMKPAAESRREEGTAGGEKNADDRRPGPIPGLPGEQPRPGGEPTGDSTSRRSLREGSFRCLRYAPSRAGHHPLARDAAPGPPDTVTASSRLHARGQS